MCLVGMNRALQVLQMQDMSLRTLDECLLITIIHFYVVPKSYTV